MCLSGSADHDAGFHPQCVCVCVFVVRECLSQPVGCIELLFVFVSVHISEHLFVHSSFVSTCSLNTPVNLVNLRWEIHSQTLSESEVRMKVELGGS